MGSLMANYLYIAILLVCFYDALIILLIPSSATFLLAGDGMAASMISMLMAMATGLGVLYTNGFNKLSNPWLAIFLFFMVFSAFHSPNIQFDSIFVPKDTGLFNFKPMFEALAYFFMYLGISNIELNKTAIDCIYKSFALVGIIYSLYIVAQHCGMDQFYKITEESAYDHLSRQPQDGGFISQPVYASAVLSMCLPFIWKYKKIMIVLPVIAILLTTNRSALVAIAIAGLYLITNNKRYVLYVLGAYIGILALAMAIYWTHPTFNLHIESCGRLETWKMILLDIIHPSFRHP